MLILTNALAEMKMNLIKKFTVFGDIWLASQYIHSHTRSEWLRCNDTNSQKNIFTMCFETMVTHKTEKLQNICIREERN